MKNDKDLKDRILELYINQNKPYREVCQILKISKGKFERICKANNIKKVKLLPSVKEIKNYYIRDNHTVEETQQWAGCSKAALSRLLKKNNIHKPNKLKQEHTKQTNKERYGNESHLRNETIKAKRQQTNLERYGNKEAIASKPIQDKIKRTNKERYGVEYPLQSPSIQEKIAQQYAKGTPQQKCCITKSLNGTWNISLPEERLYGALVAEFGLGNVKRQYKSPSYPFPCDFYIISEDLYIEYQGTWHHGPEPYNPRKKSHQMLVEKWSSKHTENNDYAVKIWTQRDPLKRKIARVNKLNFLEFFSEKEFFQWLEQF